MHKYAAPTALAIALNITMLALAVSASLTPASALTGGGNRPCGPGLSKCACYFQCYHAIGERGPFPDYNKPSPAVAACEAKCMAAKKAAQH
jgi:hypothetical protein